MQARDEEGTPPELQALLDDLEAQVATLSAGLDGLRDSIRHVARMYAGAPGAVESATQEPLPLEAYRRPAEAEAVETWSWPRPIAETEEETELEEAVIEAVAPVEAVDEAGASADAAEALEAEPAQTWSWQPQVVIPQADARPEPEPASDETEAPLLQTWSWQAEAASQEPSAPEESTAAESPHSGIWQSWLDATPPGHDPDVADYAAPIAREALETPSEATFQPVDAGTASDEEAEDAREQVRRAVEKMRAELRSGVFSDLSDDEEAEPEPVEAAESVQHVEAAPLSPDDDESRRDEVRRAVAEARAELGKPAREPAVSDRFAAFSSMPVGITDSGLNSPAAISWQQRKQDEAGPLQPSIVIEDPDGRVELARVYESLYRVERASQASLLNYTAHSVTIGLNSGTPLPTPEAMSSAVQESFGRRCSVSSAAGKLSVLIGDDLGARP